MYTSTLLALGCCLLAGGAAAQDPWRIGGAVRFNWHVNDWSETYEWPGQVDFDTARINIDYDDGRWLGSLEYRYYDFRAGPVTHMLHHGFVGYRPDALSELDIGVHRVPFGILPFASHNWFFQLPYYIGLEDDYDLGIKYVNQTGPWNWQAAWYARDEGHWRGDSDDSARYSYDLVEGLGRELDERDQFNLRAAYTFTNTPEDVSEVGASLQYGGFDGGGERWAAGIHLDALYGRWGLKLEALRYRFDPDMPTGADDDVVVMGAYDFPYRVAAAGNIYSAGVSYRLPNPPGPFDSVMFYNDYSVMVKDPDGFEDSAQNVLGAALGMGRWLIYVDLGLGKAHPFLSSAFTDALAAGSDDDWDTRFNVNVGYYF